MPVDRSALKAEARRRLREARPRPYYTGLLYVFLSGALTVLSILILSAKLTPEAADHYLRLFLAGRYEDALDYLAALYPSTGEYLLSRVLELVRGIVGVGLSVFALHLARGEEASLWNLLDGFSRIFLPLLVLATLILVSLWTQLFIIPGIIAAYRYRLAVYLMLDHPELNPLQAILLSGRMMRGRKWQLFLLDLSFAGWALLAMLPYLVLSSFPGLAMQIAGGVGSALILAWLLPYYELSCVGFYEAVKTPLRIEPPEEP